MEYYQIPNFTGGVDIVHHPLTLNDNMALKTRNLIPYAKGVLRKRQGYSLWVNVYSDNDYVVKTMKYIPFLNKLFVIIQHKNLNLARLYLIDVETKEKELLDDNFPYSNCYSIVNFLDSVYISCGTEYPVKKYQNGSLTDTSIPQSKLLLSFQGRLFIANYKYEDEYYPNYIWYSEVLEPETFDFEDVVIVGNKDEITNLDTFTFTTATETLSTQLLITKPASVYVLSFIGVPQSLDIVSNRIGSEYYSNIVKIPLGIIFFSSDGVYTLSTSGEPVNLSFPIRSILDGTALEGYRDINQGIFGIYHKGFLYTTFFVKEADEDIHTYLLDLREQPMWYGEMTGNFSCYEIVNDNLYAGSNESADIYLLNSQTGKDLDKNIDTELRTKYYAPNSEYSIKLWKRAGFNISCDTITDLTIEYIIDQGKIWGEKIIKVLGSMPKWDVDKWDEARFWLGEYIWDAYKMYFSPRDRGRFIGFRIKENSSNDVLLNNGIIGYIPTRRIL